MDVRRPVVAIVDDDPRVIEALQNLLESAGYVAIGFASAGALLGRGMAAIDVLITDVGLPGADGFELREVVGRMRPELPVFLITGRHEIADQGRAQGIEGLFRKPFDARALLAAVGNALRDRNKGE